MTRGTFSVLALTIIATMFLTGCGGVSDAAAARVNGAVITKADVDARIEYRNKLSPGMVGPEDEVNYPKILRQTTKDLVLSELEKQEGERRGISVSDEEIDNALQEMADEDYLEDVPRMLEIFAGMGVTETELRDVTRERLLHEKLKADVSGEITVSDSEIQSFYERNRQQYDQPEMRQGRMIETASQGEALEAVNRIMAGESFVEVAKQVSMDPLAAGNGGTLGLVRRGQLPPELEAVLFSMSAGQISEPASVAGKWYVLTVEAVQPGQQKSFEEAREEIRDIIAAETLASRWKSLLDGLYGDADLEYDPDYDPALG
ncbi:MAG: peptidyl-prolyl cis-trans isomerase [Thermoleophilia bacterium]|nr:peptidyl-prolyl cis-trans isomerase [Thermoleophilia bacterium]